ncbi:methylmalonyl-CoA mutase [Azoarcus sp. TTM-91]|uniref:fused isobutyryl-CoA mutase/GTPase IcmF n=1 Tax=Azoarcus sp. TTM-91 TaxID=2691581 RepID=UPI00145D426F|nr:fused isobutyryl-CoA mutase/GTPase IcmF [Azoarcus sp. TTM-91]NMG37106.1 methylmalonyl-CoA mutase [Azoarcus sp. TTM-91]
MTDLSVARKLTPYRPANKVRFVTAAALFDGHDASINIMRRILQATGAEVIHLGHNRAVGEIVAAALQEDVQGIAITSYQGGHVEFFKYMLDLLREQGAGDIKVFGGGGGVIVPAEIRELHDYGVTRIYSPEDGASLGLQGMINDLVERCDFDLGGAAPSAPAAILAGLADGDRSARLRHLARLITALENGACSEAARRALLEAAAGLRIPALGITGTGGAGKSSLTDELVRRFRLDQQDGLRIALISIDPSRKRTGGALLGDRIRMNAIDHPNIFMRSLATRETGSEVSAALPEVIAACRLAGFDLVIVETSGIGQGDAAIVPFVDLSLYVMTPEFGAASQLEKIDMLDFADFIAINKFDRKGAEDALRDVRKQYQRNRELFAQPAEEMPVFGTMASRFNDDGVTALYHALLPRLREQGLEAGAGCLPAVAVKASSRGRAVVPAERSRYLAEVADSLRGYHRTVAAQARIARERQALRTSGQLLEEAGKVADDVIALHAAKDQALLPQARALLDGWAETRRRYEADDYVVKVRDKESRTRLYTESLSGNRIRKVALPAFEDEGELLRFLMKENLPGAFPYTAGVFPFKREGEDPTRMFAGEGDPFRTNRRFHALSEGMPAHRLSTAFDSVTLYGCDPDLRPDIYGKVGNSGVSIATLDDMKVLYQGFDLCAPSTSVSMTINGPAPVILAFFFNTAIDQQLAAFEAAHGRAPDAGELAALRARTLATVRGTVQADILKEDQGQNTCIFSTEFALKMMGDIQEYFVRHKVQNFYSVSISGYHIAEAGANPISQLAFTLANGFTYVESYLARGMHIDDFAPNLSFFFSNGMDPEYTVIGRVARRIWAVAMRDRYGANERSQKLKYHVQTSGRSLHAQEMDFNDIRTTLQALIAIYDNCNSLHTNAYDEAITTPTEESVRRAMAIQLIINREWGLAKNENPSQGSFVIDALTDLVEEAVLKEFEAIASRGGVLGAMESGYQRGRIQEESLLYEHRKHDGSHPIIGVNTFLNPHPKAAQEVVLARSTEEEKRSQLARLAAFHAAHREEAPLWLARLRDTVIADGNVFEVLVEAVRHCSLGQITQALYEVGGQYRRNM